MRSLESANRAASVPPALNPATPTWPYFASNLSTFRSRRRSNPAETAGSETSIPRCPASFSRRARSRVTSFGSVSPNAFPLKMSTTAAAARDSRPSHRGRHFSGARRVLRHRFCPGFLRKPKGTSPYKPLRTAFDRNYTTRPTVRLRLARSIPAIFGDRRLTWHTHASINRSNRSRASSQARVSLGS